MADALSDIATFTSAFSQFAGSIKQLHDTRVQAESEAKAMEITEANYQLLQRWNLPVGDPNRLSLDPDDPSYWRTALESQQAEVESYLSSVKDPAIQAGVRKQLEGSTQQFALAVSNKLAEAELVETQKSRTQTLQGLVNLGQYDEAIKYFDERFVKDGLLPPDKEAEVYQSTILPIKGAKIATQAKQGKVVTDYARQGEDGAFIEGTSGNRAQAVDRFERPVNLREAQERVQSNSSLPTDEKQAALSFLAGEMKQYEAQADVMAKNAKNQQDQGMMVDAAQYYRDVLGYVGYVSDEKLADLMSPYYRGIKMQGVAGIDGAMGVIYSQAGAIRDAAGNLVGGTKLIDPVQGLKYIRDLRAAFADDASKNADVAEKLKLAEADIRRLMASGGAESEAVFDSIMNPLFIQLKTRTGGVTGRTVIGALFSNAHLVSTSRLTNLYDDVASGEWLDPREREILKEPAIRSMLLSIAKDKILGNAKDGAEIQAILSGEKGGAMVSQAYSDFVSSILNEAVTGPMLSPSELTAMIAKRSLEFTKDYQAKAYDTLKGSIRNPSYHKELAARMQMFDGRAIQMDFGGEPITPAHIAEMKRSVDALCTGALAVKKDMDMQDLIPFYGPNGEFYYTSREWERTVYKAEPGDNGFTLTEYMGDGSPLSTIVEDIQKSGTSKRISAKPYTKPVYTWEYADRIKLPEIPPQYQSPYSLQSEMYGFKEGRLEP